MLPTTGDPEPLLTVSQVATHLNVHEGRVKRLVARHGLPAYDIGDDLRFKPADFAAWLERRKVITP